MSKHDHREECQHSRLKFCKVCKVVHCLDCEKEWKEPAYTMWSWPYTQQPYYSWTNGSGLGQYTNAIPLSGSAKTCDPVNQNIYGDGHTTTCKHG